MQDPHQIAMWSSDFGKEYTERNTFDPSELDEIYKNRYSVTKTNIINKFLSDLNLQEKPILEVGCNSANELRLMQELGYQNLYGIELQPYAVEKANKVSSGINIIQGVGDDIPFKDNFFDLTFTCGVLIHIAPTNINRVLDEVYRCSKRYIWGLEYFALEYTEIKYRENSNLLWKTDFAKLYLNRFKDLQLVKEEKLKYISGENVDQIFLLEKIWSE